jgi:hypothetical protein
MPYTIQNNRDPYTDHPEYVQAIWNPTAGCTSPTAPAKFASSANNYSISGLVDWEAQLTILP